MNLKETLNRLHRSKRDQVFGGVCGGVAETTDTPAWMWRAATLFLALWFGAGALVYLILWVTMPLENNGR